MLSHRRAGAWVHAHPTAADVALALLLTVFGLILVTVPVEIEGVRLRDTDALAVLLVALSFLPLALRRRYPVPVLVAAAVPAMSVELLRYPVGTGGIGVLVALYTVAAYCPGWRSIAALVGTLVASAFVLVAIPLPIGIVDIIANAVVFGTAWVIGRNIGIRRAYTRSLEERAQALERDRDAAQAAAVQAERRRIARELHDVVAHHVSVMVVQAAAARRVLSNNPDRAEEALAVIEATGRDALVEMRRLLQVLRVAGDPAGDLTPQPGVDQLPALVGLVREAGLDVELAVEGTARPLAAGTDLSAYRIVQEALTNALKHAGPARARVLLRYDPADLAIQVTDDGRGSAAHLNGASVGHDGAGHGLLGMRERVSVYGGQLSAGPRAGGGFEVYTRLPLAATEPAPGLTAPPQPGAAAAAPMADA